MNKLSVYHPVSGVHPFVDIDRLVDSFFGNQSFDCLGAASGYPAVDIRESDGAYHLDAELPGCGEKDVEVHLDGGRLTIESKKDETQEKQHETGSYLIRERRTRHFMRSFKLPENADLTTIEAAFNDGLLTLEIKKRTEAQKRVIDIKKKIA
jgi:HSP20 family protein